MSEFRKILVANRGEIAIRVLRAANEMGKATVAVFTDEDRLALHRTKADESYRIGEGLAPVAAYLAVDEMIRVALDTGADAIHPGYGFLSESPEFAEACADNGIVFIGPRPDTLRKLGDKVSARAIAALAGVPTVPATDVLPADPEAALAAASAVGFPGILKASWGGGGRGMRVVPDPDALEAALTAARREAAAAFGKDDVYLERFIARARHLEVQVLADGHGRIVHLFERDCSVQRRNQKIVECAPAPGLTVATRDELTGYALAIAREADYLSAGTVEFLHDLDTGRFHFIEVNPRIQVEHTVTEEVTGVDLVRAQIRIAEGGAIEEGPDAACPPQGAIALRGHAVQCRITTEDPLDRFIPDYGRITAYRGATGFGIRLDGGTAYSGAVITRHYDSLLEKVTAWAPSREGAIDRMRRALREFRIRGVATNIAFLARLVGHDAFRHGQVTTRFIDENPELLAFARPRDRASRLLRHIAETTVNGHPEVKDRPLPPAHARNPRPPHLQPESSVRGAKALLDAEGPTAVAQWMLDQTRVLVTDTSMRDAPQSLLATRMRTCDMERIAQAYARNLPDLFSIECWGGATFDVALRFLGECPWERLRRLRAGMPDLLLQMLLRASNAVGYTNYPDNVVQGFVARAATSGIDLFRIFDPLNSVENMRVAIDAVLASGRICEAAICYTGDLHDPGRSRYDHGYYVRMARELRDAGTHVIGIKDMAGLVKPGAARELVEALKAETGLPVHFHTHDTSGIAAASVLGAVEAGVDAVDLAMDSLSGFTSQPCLGSVVEALRGRPRDTGLDPARIREISDYWEAVRAQYAAFETDMRAPASEVYLHEMPGGQFTNLREQARALGLAERWHEVGERLRRSQPDVRGHREGDPDLQGCGRPGAGDGLRRSHPCRRRGSESRHRVSGVGGGTVSRRARPHAGRIPGAAREEDSEGRGAARRASGCAASRCGSRGGTREGGGGDRLVALRGGALLLPSVPEGISGLCGAPQEVRSGVEAFDRGVLLRAAAGARGLDRPRSGADPRDSMPRHRRDRRRRQRPGLLRAERTAAFGQGGEPGRVRVRGTAAEGRFDQPPPRGGSDAGGRGLPGRHAGALGRRRRSPDDHRSDEDGDRPARRARRHGGGAACRGGTVRRRQGPAAGVLEGLSAGRGAESSGLGDRSVSPGPKAVM